MGWQAHLATYRQATCRLAYLPLGFEAAGGGAVLWLSGPRQTSLLDHLPTCRMG